MCGSDLIASVDGLAPLLRLGVLHLAVSVKTVQEVAARRLPAHLEGAPHSGYPDIPVTSVLRVAVLATTRLLVQDSVHETDGALLPTARARARAQASASTTVGDTPAPTTTCRVARGDSWPAATGDREAANAAEGAAEASGGGRVDFVVCLRAGARPSIEAVMQGHRNEGRRLNLINLHPHVVNGPPTSRGH